MEPQRSVSGRRAGIALGRGLAWTVWVGLGFVGSTALGEAQAVPTPSHPGPPNLVTVVVPDDPASPPDGENARSLAPSLGVPAPPGSAQTPGRGRLFHHLRLRFESADQDGLAPAEAWTVRGRIGYASPRLRGFEARVELEANEPLNPGEFASYPPPFNEGRTVVADPRSRSLNQAHLDWTGEFLRVVLGRQALGLDNERFVGTVGWRQVNQTVDGIRAEWRPLGSLEFGYAYLARVHRIFGSRAPTAELRRFRGNVHLLRLRHVGSSGTEWTAYLHDLDLEGEPRGSGTTVGGVVSGRLPLPGPTDAWSFRLEYAHRWSDSFQEVPAFDGRYVAARLGFDSGGRRVALGFEELGGDGARGFETPLATLHAHNGWADVFLATPTAGLRDLHLSWELPIPGVGGTGFGEGHHYRSARGGDIYGHELGIGLRRGFGARFAGSVKATRYRGRETDSFPGSAAGRDRIWIQVEHSR